MKHFLNKNLALNYNSNSQKIRVLTENWVHDEIYCPSCGTDVRKYERNRPVADFYCPVCKEDFELKSKGNSIGRKIVDGAYRTAIERLESNHNPNLFLLAYNPLDYEVLNFCVIPKYFFVPEIIERRQPLSKTAHRAGWVGCNIALENVPQAGRIFYIRDKVILPQKVVLESWQKTIFLKKTPTMNVRGWIIDIMNCIESLGNNEFSLNDIYGFETELQKKHPSNLHIREKIRQQLQVLRNKGYLKFTTRGQYQVI